MGTIEERRHPRINVDFFADWGWGPDCEYYDRITSLSVSGCFLSTRRELEMGQEIYIRWTSDSTGQLNLKGAVRSQLRVREDAPPTGAGIEFVNLSVDARRKLQALIERLEIRS
jgi:hypothetical protein